MDCFKSECQKFFPSSDGPITSVSRKKSLKEQQEQPQPQPQENHQEEQPMNKTEDGKSIEENDSDPKLLSHSPSKPNLLPLASKEETIDWDTYPLPEDGIWERRYDKRTGKVAHPLPPSLFLCSCLIFSSLLTSLII
jgi:hypothetical protein